MQTPTVQLFVTGGTFEKSYDPVKETLSFRGSRVPDILKRADIRVDVRVKQLMLIDSLDMTDDQREEIMLACLQTPYEHIVITHGTSTMTETAQLIAKNVTSKVVVLTGAMVPYQMGGVTDAMFNIGMAFGAVQSLVPGVYVCMNGIVFPAHQVQKNVSGGFFEFRADSRQI